MKNKANSKKKPAGVGHLSAHRVTFTLDSALWAELEAQAKEKSLPVSTYVRMILSEKYAAAATI